MTRIIAFICSRTSTQDGHLASDLLLYRAAQGFNGYALFDTESTLYHPLIRLWIDLDGIERSVDVSKHFNRMFQSCSKVRVYGALHRIGLSWQISRLLFSDVRIKYVDVRRSWYIRVLVNRCCSRDLPLEVKNSAIPTVTLILLIIRERSEVVFHTVMRTELWPKSTLTRKNSDACYFIVCTRSRLVLYHRKDKSTKSESWWVIYTVCIRRCSIRVPECAVQGEMWWK